MPISDIDKINVELIIETINSAIYTYFRENYGLLDNSSSILITNNKHMSKSALKSSLKSLTMSNAPFADIKYVAKCLRFTLQPTAHSALAGKNHDIQIQKNFWGYIKANFKQSMSPSPTFDCSICIQFFATFFCSIFPSKSFKIPDWIPSLAQSSILYDLTPPSYNQITKVVPRIKASGSHCPLHKISIIIFKRCPYLRSYLTDLFRIIRKSGKTPHVWKRACTILIHKKVIIQIHHILGLLPTRQFLLRYSLPAYMIQCMSSYNTMGTLNTKFKRASFPSYPELSNTLLSLRM